MSTGKQAEYLVFAVENQPEFDPHEMCDLLYVFLNQAISPQYRNKARTISIRFEPNANSLAFSISVAHRELITYQKTASKRPLFLEVVFHSLRFLRFYVTTPRLVFFSDQVGWLQSLQNPVRKIGLLDLDKSRAEVGVVLEFE